MTVINTIKAFEILSANGNGASCHKTAIYVVAGPAPSEISGRNKVDNNSFVLPEGFHLSIGSKCGELQPLLREKKGTLQPTHATLYDMDNPMTYDEATTAAQERGIAIATPENVAAAFEALGNEMSFAWHTSNGHVMAYRMPAEVGNVELPKPTWWDVQNGNGEGVVVVNLLTDEVYLIEKEQFLAQWHADSNPAAKGKDLYSLIPVMDSETFTSIVHQGSTAQELLVQQQKELGLL